MAVCKASVFLWKKSILKEAYWHPLKISDAMRI